MHTGTKLDLNSRLCFEIRLLVISWAFTFHRFKYPLLVDLLDHLVYIPLAQLVEQITSVQNKVHGSLLAQNVVSLVNFPEKCIWKKQHWHCKGICNQYTRDIPRNCMQNHSDEVLAIRMCEEYYIGNFMTTLFTLPMKDDLLE